MKIIYFILLFIVWSSVLIAQDKKDSNLKNYSALMKEYADKFHDNSNSTFDINNEKELKKMARVIFESNIDPVKKYEIKQKDRRNAKLEAGGNKEIFRSKLKNSYNRVENNILKILKKNILNWIIT